MSDVLFLLVIVVFFAVALLFVKACERIIDTGAEATPLDSPADVETEAA
jgi:hypothetical protein